MNPSDFDDDGDSLSFSDLPPSVARQYAQQMAAFVAPTGIRSPVPTGVSVSAPVTSAQPVPGPVLAPKGFVPTGAVTRPGATAAVPVPVQQYRQTNPIQQVAPGQIAQPEAPKDNSTLWFIGAALLLSGVGYWAYTKMEKDKRKIRVGPPGGQTASYGDDDGDTSGSDDDDGEESGSALDAYEDAGLDPSDVDPHEEGGIKLVKG